MVSKLNVNNICTRGNGSLYTVSKLIVNLDIGFDLATKGVLICMVHYPMTSNKGCNACMMRDCGIPHWLRMGIRDIVCGCGLKLGAFMSVE